MWNVNNLTRRVGFVPNYYLPATKITARKRSCRKVMFLHLSVILFTGRVSVQVGGLCPKVGLCPEGSLCPEVGLCPEGGLCPGGVSVQGGLSDPPYGKEKAVHILLECILV